MAVPHDIQYGTFAERRAALSNDAGQARTKTLGVLVAIMVAAGVVALIMTLFSDKSNNSQAATQPSGSQVDNQTSSSATAGTGSATGAPSSTSTSSPSAPSTSTSSTGASSTGTPSTTVPATSKPAAPTPAKTSASTGTSTKIVKYTVKKGDNLTLIAKWFSQRGVAPVYDWNKSVIGKNPNLIYPGQTIIVSLTGDKMNVSTKNK